MLPFAPSVLYSENDKTMNAAEGVAGRPPGRRLYPQLLRHHAMRDLHGARGGPRTRTRT